MRLVPLLLMLTGAACAPAQGAPSTSPTRPATTSPAATTSSPTAASFDQQFIDMMVPHHQGAIEMARIAQTRAQHPEIKAMADDIIASQAAEIDQLKAWRTAWFGSDQTPPMSQMPMIEGVTTGSGGHSGGHGGMSGTSSSMDMTRDVEALRNAPEPFDRAFIAAMIPHHQDAVAAAKAAGDRAQHQEIKQVAQAIIAAQEREIAQMQQWQQAWFGATTPGTQH